MPCTIIIMFFFLSPQSHWTIPLSLFSSNGKTSDFVSSSKWYALFSRTENKEVENTKNFLVEHFFSFNISLQYIHTRAVYIHITYVQYLFFIPTYMLETSRHNHVGENILLGSLKNLLILSLFFYVKKLR